LSVVIIDCLSSRLIVCHGNSIAAELNAKPVEILTIIYCFIYAVSYIRKYYEMFVAAGKTLTLF